MTPRVLEGVVIDESAREAHCKVCAAPIWWGHTAAGKRNPFDIVDGARTAVTHFSTCPEVRQFEKGRRPA